MLLFLDLGMLLESHRNPTGLCGGLVEFGVRVQRAGRDLAGDPPLREGRRARPELPRRLHQPGKRAQGGKNFRQVS